MGDIFTRYDAAKFFKNKTVWIFGDSTQCFSEDIQEKIIGVSKTNMVVQKYKLSTFGETKRLLGDEALTEPILFKDKLYVYNEEGKRIGRFFLSINQEESKVHDTSKLLYVHISNRAFVDGNLSESVVTGTVTQKLKTLEEIRYECTNFPNTGKHERCMFLLRENTKYYLSVTNTICDYKSHNHSTISFAEALGMIGECSNAVLLRKLAIKGYEGILCLRTILSNGARCKNYYVTKLSNQLINGRRMQVLIIYRNVTNHKKYNVTMTMALTRAGQLIYLFWSNTKCFLHLDPDVNVDTHKFTSPEPKLQYHWHQDIQLHSLYLDRVAFQSMVKTSFEYQNESLRRLLGDFIEFVLLSKPEDIICFAIQYFTAFGHNAMKKCTSKKLKAPETFRSPLSHYYQEYEGEHSYDWIFGESFSSKG